MKRKLVLLIILVLLTMVAILSNNNQNDTEHKLSNVKKADNEKGMYDSLTEQQKKYLTEEQRFTEDAINEMGYEGLNWQLLGTGFELYNQSSGVEDFGLTYQEETPIPEKNETGECITLEQLLQIRHKEKDMRLDDFAKYQYKIKELESNPEEGQAYQVQLPVKEYDSTYVHVNFLRDKKKNIEMKAPYLYYKEGEEDGWAFSILYDKAMFENFYMLEPKLEVEGKTYMGVQYTSVTENSLVMQLYNWKDEDMKLQKSYELYEVTSEGEKLIDSAKGEEVTKRLMSFSIEPVKFSDDVKLEQGKTYLIKYGKDKEGYLYDEVEFEFPIYHINTTDKASVADSE